MEVPTTSRGFGPDKIIKASFCLKQGLGTIELFSELHHQHPHSSHIPGKAASPNNPWRLSGEGRVPAEAKATPWVWASGAAQVCWLERAAPEVRNTHTAGQAWNAIPLLPFKTLLLASFWVT